MNNVVEVNFVRKDAKMKNIFADKATLIPRKMLKEAGKKWTVRDFSGADGVSVGLAQEVLAAMEKKGYVERVKRGPGSYTILTNREQLIADWLRSYRFDLNTVKTYYSPDNGCLERIRDCLREDQYALTLHSGANLQTSFVRTGDIYLYVNLKEWDKEVVAIRQKLQLKELVRGGNVHLIRPFFKNSVFFNRQKIKGYLVVSNLQLYLDLYHFQPRGKEQAEQLRKLLQGKGRQLA